MVSRSFWTISPLFIHFFSQIENSLFASRKKKNEKRRRREVALCPCLEWPKIPKHGVPPQSRAHFLVGVISPGFPVTSNFIFEETCTCIDVGKSISLGVQFTLTVALELLHSLYRGYFLVETPLFFSFFPLFDFLLLLINLPIACLKLEYGTSKYTYIRCCSVRYSLVYY